MKKTNIKEHIRRRQELTKIAKFSFTVREAMELWGYESTSAAIYELKKLVELGLVEYEQKGQSGKYILKTRKPARLLAGISEMAGGDRAQDRDR